VETRLISAQQYKRNFVIHLVERAFMFFGENQFLFSQEIVIGLFKSLGALPSLIGIAFGATKLSYLIQILTAKGVEAKPRKKMFLLRIGLAYRAPFLIMGLALWLFAASRPQAALVAAIAGFWASWVIYSVMNPPLMDLYGDTIVAKSRFFSYKVIVGAVVGTVVALLVKWLFKSYGFPTKYIVLLLIAFGLSMVSWLLFTRVLDNPEKTVPDRCASSIGGYLVSAAQLIKRDRTLAVFLGGRITNEMCYAFLFLVTLEYLHRFQLTDAALGNVMFFRFIPAIAVAYLAGRFSERFGPRKSLVVGAAALVLMFIMAAVIGSATLYLLVFLLMTVHLSIWSACEPDAMLEISPADSRVAYTTIIMFIPNTIGALTAPLGGMLAERFGYGFLFALATAIAAVSLGCYALVSFMKAPGVAAAKPGRCDHSLIRHAYRV
jgi:hypothetical protein